MLPKLRNWPEHPLYAATASAKGKAKPPKLDPSAWRKAKLGALPEWNLADLYEGPDVAKAQGRSRNLRACG